MFNSMLSAQVQGKHEAALDAVKGNLGKLVTMADEKRSLQAGLHVSLCWHE